MKWVDYNVCIIEYGKALAVEKIINKVHSQYQLTDMRKGIVVSSFSYSESCDSDGALIFSSDKCLEVLANDMWWSLDATFCMLKNGNIKFTTVSIQKEVSGRKNRVIFFKKLLELMKEKQRRNKS